MLAFYERLRALPGQVDLQIQVDPPLAEAEVASLSGGLRLPIPAPLRRFLTRASAACCCCYTWDAPAEYEKRVGDICYTRSWFLGGPTLFKASAFEYALRGYYDTAVAMEEAGYPEEHFLWANSFPLCDLSDIDSVGILLRPRHSAKDYPVFYLRTDGGSKILDTNFEEFLRHWEELYYAWPDTLLLLCDPTTGKINHGPTANQPLHKLFVDALGATVNVPGRDKEKGKGKRSAERRGKGKRGKTDAAQ